MLKISAALEMIELTICTSVAPIFFKFEISQLLPTNFLIINCIGKNDKLGLRINKEFFVHTFKEKENVNEKLVQETLGSIRDIILERSQHRFLNFYQKLDFTRRMRSAEAQFLTIFPKMLEFLSFIPLDIGRFLLSLSLIIVPSLNSKYSFISFKFSFL